METLFTVGKLSTEQFSAPQTTLSMCVKSCSPSRGWKVSPNVKIKVNVKVKEDFHELQCVSVFCVLAHRFSGGLGRGSAEDRDPAEQDQ